MSHLHIHISPGKRSLAFALLLAASSAHGQITDATPDQAPPIQGAGHDYIRLPMIVSTQI